LIHVDNSHSNLNLFQLGCVVCVGMTFKKPDPHQPYVNRSDYVMRSCLYLQWSSP